jgi:hypothetical protein
MRMPQKRRSEGQRPRAAVRWVGRICVCRATRSLSALGELCLDPSVEMDNGVPSGRVALVEESRKWLSLTLTHHSLSLCLRMERYSAYAHGVEAFRPGVTHRASASINK